MKEPTHKFRRIKRDMRNRIPTCSMKAVKSEVKASPAKRTRILHVDDDFSFLQISKMILELENKFEIDIVASVDEAFCKLKRQTYEAVISDYDMPLKNGLDFLNELREGGNKIPFILFTGKGLEEITIKALTLGADGYINKQGDTGTVFGELSHEIRRLVENKATDRIHGDPYER